MNELKLARLQKKIDKRDARIAGLERRIQQLESQLTMKDRFPYDLRNIVQDALCNVRMIPVHGLGKSVKIKAEVDD